MVIKPDLIWKKLKLICFFNIIRSIPTGFTGCCGKHFPINISSLWDFDRQTGSSITITKKHQRFVIQFS